MNEPQTHEEVLAQVTGPTPDYYRGVLRYFDSSWADAATLDELATYLLDSEGAEQDLKIRLHHAILPKLADTGLVSYDSSDKVVRYQWDSLEEANEQEVITE